MHRDNKSTYFSATDLADFIVCRHITSLGLFNLETPLQKKPADEEIRILQDLGIEHEKNYFELLKAGGTSVVEVASNIPHAKRVEQTIDAMRSGADVIYQAAFESGSFRGYADFLLKVASASKLGGYSYEVADTKLARQGKAKHIVQIALYSDMLQEIQGLAPENAYLQLGDNTSEAKPYRLDEYRHYVGALKQRFLDFTQQQPTTIPEKCSHCKMCAWEDLCKAKWIEDDHLNQVANIRSTDIRKLRAAGINTLESLALASQSVPSIGSFTTLQAQATLQLQKRQTGEDVVLLKQPDSVAGNGFYRLPEPDEGDLYFDMEGYPHEKDGLEYLFGVCYRENRELKFKAFWGHDRAEEKLAFEQFIDFVMDRIAKNPNLHIYHYADYERRALEKLMQLHGTREAEVDQIFRDHRLVDLYAVVRHAIMTSEPRYSIKNLETFYMKDARQSDVKNAGASIIYYEHWRKDRNQKWLDDIERYNEEDCESTEKLHTWLLELRLAAEDQFNVKEMPWHQKSSGEEGPPATPKARTPKSLAAEARKIAAEALKNTVRASLTTAINALADSPERRAAELMRYLIDFYKRESKPSSWKMFDQQEKTPEELINDLDAIGGLTLDESASVIKDIQSLIFSYNMPQQEHRLKVGDAVRDTRSLQGVGAIFAIDTAKQIIQLRIGQQKLTTSWDAQMPGALSIAASEHVVTGKLEAAILRLAESRYGDEPNENYAAVWSLLERQWPNIERIEPGSPILAGDASVDAVISVVQRLRDSYLIIQGPPGTGKTYTGARVILKLLEAGKRVGVCATSHKAVANLLNAVTAAAIEENITFIGARKGDQDSPLEDDRFIKDVTNSEDTFDPTFRLVGGTAWVFAPEEADQTYDYLFVDEAGQVSLANLVAMGCAAKNIVLLGDQMQLGQPLQGMHPGDSGLSALEYLLIDNTTVPAIVHPTVPVERGILLNVSRRMHPDVCRFISAAVYEGRLTNFRDTANQRLVLKSDADPALRETGIVFDPIMHEGCAQTSQAEAERIRVLIASLRQQSFVNQKGVEQKIEAGNILVVAPYNAQVRILRDVLPPDTRIGTVDKFQGQEAEVVIVSMTTSGAEELPRNMEFLFDRHRLNVAISRAKTLAIIVASPALLEIDCNTPEQIALVDTLNWAVEYSAKK